MMRLLPLVPIAALGACAVLAVAQDKAPDTTPKIIVHRFEPLTPLSRARRDVRLRARIENTAETRESVVARLILPADVKLVSPRDDIRIVLNDADETDLIWSVEAAFSGEHTIGLEVEFGDGKATSSLTIRFLPSEPVRKLDYIPAPKPVKSSVLIGAHHCPLWEADKYHMWDNVLKHPERTPALGFYAQENPEVSDWETKWASEHGIDFFVYCWYRDGQGGPVKQNFGSAIHDAFLKSRYQKQMKFTIMWENQQRGRAGVADEKDLTDNLLPFWIKNYFTHPSYLKVDNKPVLFIYRPEFLVDDLGGVDKVVRAFDLMRKACRAAGFDGLTILGEYRGLDPKHLALMKSLSLDYTFAYCWYVPDNPTPDQAIAAQMDYIRKTQALNILPQVVTVSQAWSGWQDEGTIWKIPPPKFETLLREAKRFIGTLPSTQLGSRMLLLDNWNEWGEGHYIAPYREYGFGYLDAVRNVFTNAGGPHTDVIPEDVGLGPYDKAYREFEDREQDARRQGSRRVVKTGAPAEGLVGWWAFDEPETSPVAMDYSGNRLGAMVRNAKRAPGIDGNALVCDGGSARVGSRSLLNVTSALSVTCWVKADKAGQGNNWMVNRVFSGGTSTGFRLGLLDDKPCFEVPLTDFSHHLTAPDALTVGKWTHLAGTFDGKTMRLYVDGVEKATMDRPGPAKPNNFPLLLGNFEEDHKAFFSGLLDEVRLYSRCLSAAEVAAQHKELAAKAEQKPKSEG